MAREGRPAVTLTLEIARDARREHLGELLAFVKDACERLHLPAEAAFAVRLATEEACTNVITHGYTHTAPGPIVVRFHGDDLRVKVTIEDHGARFDPMAIAPPDLAAPAETRSTGGLGWHFIQQVMDEVRHEYARERGNLLTLVKHLPSPEEEKSWR